MARSDPPYKWPTPLPVPKAEAGMIVDVVRQFYGADAVVRSWGNKPNSLSLHVEADQYPEPFAKDECMGILYTQIDKPIWLDFTKRSYPPKGYAKIAYRIGQVL